MAASLPTQGNRFHSSLRSISPTSGVNVADNDGEGGVFALYGRRWSAQRGGGCSTTLS
jgi:hypothetical protein